MGLIVVGVAIVPALQSLEEVLDGEDLNSNSIVSPKRSAISSEL